MLNPIEKFKITFLHMERPLTNDLRIIKITHNKTIISNYSPGVQNCDILITSWIFL